MEVHPLGDVFMSTNTSGLANMSVDLFCSHGSSTTTSSPAWGIVWVLLDLPHA